MQTALDQIRHCSTPQVLAEPQSNGSWLRLDRSFHVSGYIRNLPLADMCKRCRASPSVALSARLAQHREDAGRRADLDRIHNLEAMPAVQGSIQRVRGPEICRTMLPVALAKAVPQQRGPTPLVPVQHFDTDQRQVPMRLGWPVMFGHLEGAADIGLLFTSNAFCKDRLERAIIAANARWKPKCDAVAVAGALRRPRFKRTCSEGSEQSRDVQQILMRVLIDPSRDRIRGKSQNELGDGTIDFAGAGDDPDGRIRLISSFSPAAKIIAVTHRQLLFLKTSPSGIGQVGQIFINRPELFIAHSSDRLPRHFLADFVTTRVDPRSHRRDEFLKLPSFHKIEVGPERAKLTRHAAGQLCAMASATILIRQDVFAVL